MNKLSSHSFIHLGMSMPVIIALMLSGCGAKEPETLPTTLLGGSMQGSPLMLSTAASTLAGSGIASSFDSTTGTAASFNNPYGITTDGKNLYVADTSSHKIRKVEISTGKVTTLAGSGVAGSVDATGTAASFNNPYGVTTDGNNLYVTDTWNSKIRKVVIATGEVTTLAGSGTKGSLDSTGVAASFNFPEGITTDGKNLYISDNSNHKIRKIVIATGVVTTVAGSGTAGSVDGKGAAASFNFPDGITTDGRYLYVADYGNFKIRRIAIVTGEVTTLAGTGKSGSQDGTGTAASFNYPEGITTDGYSLYVTDNSNHKIRKIVIGSGAVTTLSGLGKTGSLDAMGTASTFNYPDGITTDGRYLYVADTGNQKIRKIQ